MITSFKSKFCSSSLFFAIHPVKLGIRKKNNALIRASELVIHALECLLTTSEHVIDTSDSQLQSSDRLLLASEGLLRSVNRTPIK